MWLVSEIDMLCMCITLNSSTLLNSHHQIFFSELITLQNGRAAIIIFFLRIGLELINSLLPLLSLQLRQLFPLILCTRIRNISISAHQNSSLHRHPFNPSNLFERRLRLR